MSLLRSSTTIQRVSLHALSYVFVISHFHLNCSVELEHILTSRRPKIKAAISSGTTVIIDRYYYSGIVYSAAKQNPSMSLEWCRQPDVGLPRPDMVVFLHISPEDAAKRGGFGTERYEKKEMQDRVRALFGEVRSRKEGDDFVVVDAGGSVEDVQAAIQEQVKRRIAEVDQEGKPLRTVGEW